MSLFYFLTATDIRLIVKTYNVISKYKFLRAIQNRITCNLSWSMHDVNSFSNNGYGKSMISHWAIEHIDCDMIQYKILSEYNSVENENAIYNYVLPRF